MPSASLWTASPARIDGRSHGDPPGDYSTNCSRTAAIPHSLTGVGATAWAWTVLPLRWSRTTTPPWCSGGVCSSTGRDPIPVAAVLVASTAAPRTWLVASLDIATAVHNDFQRAIQHGRFSETIDADIIARHSPLDTRAAAIDWDDPTVVLRKSSNGTTTVADALSELAEWDQRAWTWIADECPTFGGLYLRARHPELVRQY